MPPAKILFLAANPAATTPLSLDEEVRGIEEKLRASELRDAFALISRWATRPDDLQRNLLELNPTIVHFSGHGSASGGLALHGVGDAMQVVAPEAIAGLFTVLRDSVRVVFFNTCHSLALAEAVARTVDCVVGMSDEFGDQAARIFAAAFYRGLGFGRSVGEAFELGRSALRLAGIPEDQTPRLFVRHGVDPGGLYVLAPIPAGRAGPAASNDARPRVVLLAAPEDTPWLKKLQVHLRPIARATKFEVWDSSQVPPGARWRDAVEEGFSRARAVVVVVSPALLADDDFAESRLPELLRRADSRTVRLLSLIVSPCAFSRTELEAYHPLNPPDEPLDMLPPAEQGRRLVAAAEQIATAASGQT